MSLLKSEPSRVATMDELFALAHAMEDEAATRYAQIAGRLRADGNPSLAEVFERLAAEERGHLDSVVHWSQREKGRAPDPSLVRWAPPDTFDDEGAGTTDPRLLTAYRSLSMAVRNEERAFAFWSYVAAHAASEEIRRAVEAMAHEELDHVATLRRERRRAYHAERARGAGAAVGPSGAAALERRLAETLEELAAASGAGAACARELAEEARGNSDELERQEGFLPRDLRFPSDIPDDPVALAELLVDGYLEAAERIRDEAALARMQDLAGRAIRRLAWLRADLPELA
jgi:rubrerythrin